MRLVINRVIITTWYLYFDSLTSYYFLSRPQCVISFHRWNKQNTVTYSNLCKLVSSAPLLWIDCLTTQTRTYEVFASNSGQGHYKIHEKHEQNKKTIPLHYIWLANPVKLKVNESKKHEIKRNFHISSMWPNVYTKKWHFYRKVFRIFCNIFLKM